MADEVVFSPEKLMNNEWMDLDTKVRVSDAEKYGYHDPDWADEPFLCNFSPGHTQIWPDQSNAWEFVDFFDDPWGEIKRPRHMRPSNCDDEAPIVPNLDERAEKHAEDEMNRSMGKLTVDFRDELHNDLLRALRMGAERELATIRAEMEDDVFDAYANIKKRDVERRFTWHSGANPSVKNAPESYIIIRDEAKRLANMLVERCPESCELENAIDALDMAVMWANAAIARPPLFKEGSDDE